MAHGIWNVGNEGHGNLLTPFLQRPTVSDVYGFFKRAGTGMALTDAFIGGNRTGYDQFRAYFSEEELP